MKLKQNHSPHINLKTVWYFDSAHGKLSWKNCEIGNLTAVKCSPFILKGNIYMSNIKYMHVNQEQIKNNSGARKEQEGNKNGASHEQIRSKKGAN